MLRVRCLTFGCVLGLVTLCFVSTTRVQAQTKKPGESAQADQTLKQLLTEVRELEKRMSREDQNP